MIGFIIGLGVGLLIFVGAIGYLYSNGSTLIWKSKGK